MTPQLHHGFALPILARIPSNTSSSLAVVAVEVLSQTALVAAAVVAALAGCFPALCLWHQELPIRLWSERAVAAAPSTATVDLPVATLLHLDLLPLAVGLAVVTQ